MEIEKLIAEHKATLASLIEKTEYVYSEEFYKLSQVDRQKYLKDKMATESHLNTLSSLLWEKIPVANNVTDFLALSILGSMFGGLSHTAPTVTPLPDNNENAAADKKVYSIPKRGIEAG